MSEHELAVASHPLSCSCCGGDLGGDAEAQQSRVYARLILTFLGGALVLNAFIAEAVLPDGEAIGGISAFIGAVCLGASILTKTVKDLSQGVLHMNELVALALLGCFALHDYKTAGVVAFFMLMADLIQSRTALGARASIEALIRLTPQRGRVIRSDGSEEEVDAHQLVPGQRVRIRPGENVPADGVIRSGSASINESTITGEALPADKGQGDQVFAGTTNLTGMLEVEVTRAGDDTTLGKVKHLILQAEQTKRPLLRIIDRYAQWYVPAVVMIAAIIWFFTRDGYRAIAVLVVTCPCALILATPTAMVAALSAAARLGILVKNVSDLETAGNITAMFLDKTGTLTTGQLAVTRLAPAEGVDGGDLLKAAAAVAAGSNHPASKAVMAVAKKARLEVAAAERFSETAGKGVSGVVDGRRILLGRPEWLAKEGIPAPDVAAPEGITPLCVGRGNDFLGWIGLKDETRPEARKATQELRDLGLRRLFMLTGDRWTVARRVAEELLCTDLQAECLPEMKLELVEKLKRDGHLVAVVGDGVNDAPALAAGHIGVAMGAAGSDIAIDSASIALMGSDLSRLPFLVRLSRKTRRVVNQNLIFGAIFVAGGMTVAGLGYLSAIVAAILHNIGSFFVIFNSARLVRYGEELTPPLEDGR